MKSSLCEIVISKNKERLKKLEKRKEQIVKQKIAISKANEEYINFEIEKTRRIIEKWGKMVIG